MSLNYLNVYSVNNFYDIKNELIKLIDEDKNGKNQDDIFKTDYHSTNKGKWFDFFKKNILNSFSSFFIEKYNVDKLLIDCCWYQIYMQKGYHKLHVHPNTNFTNIFYLQLPGPENSTVVDKKLLQIKEGDIVSFPGFIPHESKPNIYKKPKIIISFNSSLEMN